MYTINAGNHRRNLSHDFILSEAKAERKKLEAELANVHRQLRELEGTRFKAKQKKEILARIDYLNMEIDRLKK